MHRLAWLVPALVVLTLLAVSNYPDIAGHPLPRLPLPKAVTDALDIVRASGRLFWPVAYVLVFVAMLAAYRLPARVAGMLLATLLTIQMVDLTGLFAATRASSAEAGAHRLYVRTLDPRWGSAIAAARDISFEPPDTTLDLSLFQEVAWRAASLGRPVRIAYTARDSLATKRRLAPGASGLRRGPARSAAAICADGDRFRPRSGERAACCPGRRSRRASGERAPALSLAPQPALSICKSSKLCGGRQMARSFPQLTVFKPPVIAARRDRDSSNIFGD